MSKMGFDDFKKEVVDNVVKYLPESFHGAEVGLNVVTKPNDVVLTGLTIRKAGSRMAPTIYLEEFYSQIESGDDIGVVLRRIADMRMANDVEDLDFDDLLDFEKIKDKIFPRLYGAELNSMIVNHRANTRIGDFIVTYILDLGQNEYGKMTLPVDKEVLSYWNISVEELHRIALQNQHDRYEGVFRSMNEFLRTLMCESIIDEANGGTGMEDELFEETIFDTEYDSKMYYISNNSGVYGASQLLDEDFMDCVADKVGDGFYILPASIHEVIIIPNGDELDLDYMETMVFEINRAQVSVDERLSDHVYRYHKGQGFSRAA